MGQEDFSSVNAEKDSVNENQNLGDTAGDLKTVQGVKRCQYIESEYVMPGWGCCKCSLYNGAWRQFCKGCKHPVCVEMPADKVAESTMMAARAQGLAVPDQNA